MFFSRLSITFLYTNCICICDSNNIRFTNHSSITVYQVYHSYHLIIYIVHVLVITTNINCTGKHSLLRLILPSLQQQQHDNLLYYFLCISSKDKRLKRGSGKIIGAKLKIVNIYFYMIIFVFFSKSSFIPLLLIKI